MPGQNDNHYSVGRVGLPRRRDRDRALSQCSYLRRCRLAACFTAGLRNIDLIAANPLQTSGILRCWRGRLCCCSAGQRSRPHY